MKLRTLRSNVQLLRSTIPVAQPVSWRAGKESSTKRGYGYKWQQARAGYLAKHPLCVYCERDGRVAEATIVDHRIPHRGDQALFWDRANWQGLCASCHSGVKQREERDIDGGHLVRELREIAAPVPSGEAAGVCSGHRLRP